MDNRIRGGKDLEMFIRSAKMLAREGVLTSSRPDVYRYEDQQHEEYEVWLARQNMKMLSEAKQLEHAEFEHREMIARIKWQNIKYKYTLASFKNYRKKPF